MRCHHCGLPTAGEDSHGTVEQCLQALIEETRRLREEIASLQRASPADRPVPRPGGSSRSDDE